MFQSVRYLPCKHGDLSLIPGTHAKNLSMMACAYHPSARDIEQVDLWNNLDPVDPNW